VEITATATLHPLSLPEDSPMLKLPEIFVTAFTGLTNLSIPGATHRLGTADLVVQVYDLTGTTLTAQTMGAMTIDTMTFDVLITFHQAVTGRAVLLG
jgi:hypothetical protein